MKNYELSVVKNSAQGRWREIFSVLAPQLSKAMEQPGRHVPCPVHGGTDGFRLFPDFEESGGGVSNSEGPKASGIALLMWVNGWSFKETLARVGEFLNLGNTNVLATETEGAKFSGKVLFAGFSKGNYGVRYTVRLQDKPGNVKYCHGKDLQRAVETAGIKVGDNACLTMVCTQTRKNVQGQTYRQHLWTAERLESDAERQARLAKENEESQRRRNVLIKVWREAKPLDWETSDPVIRYLASRGLPADSMADPERWLASIRFAPALEYSSGDGKVVKYPAMVSVVRNAEGRAVSIHRTYLTNDGHKAPVDCPKKLMPIPAPLSLTGSTVRLGPEVKDVLCVAEGIETALSVCIGTGFPCWSAVNANGMKGIDIPESVKAVFIFADKDRSMVGEEVALSLMKRLSEQGKLGVVVNISDDIPENAKGIDWNDILVKYGVERFPIRAPGYQASLRKEH